MHHSREFHENQAGAWDMVIVLLSTVLALTLWKESGENIIVLITYAVGNGLGTKYAVRHNAKHHYQQLADEYRKTVDYLI